MTFIQPNKNKSFLNIIIVLFVVAIVSGIFGMVALYNATVNLNHNLTEAKKELDAVGAASTKLNNQIVAALAGSSLTAAVTRAGLVEEKKPNYFSTQGTRENKSWPIASQY